MQFTAGRDIGPQDVDGSQEVAVLNESMARQLFGNENPIGRRFGWVAPRFCCYEVIGVVKDAKYLSLRQESRPMYYVSYAQANFRNQMTLVARTAGDTAPLAAAIQREVRALNPQMPRFEVETLAAQVDASLTQERLIAMLSSVFGVLALVLVCIGLYGVMAYDVARRTHEIGIRMALGAQAGDVLTLVIRQGLTLVAVGIVFGIAGVLALTRLLKSFLFGVTPTDPLTFAAVSLLLVVVALLACWIPTRRATKVDPLIALRHE
jgi:predicted permease